MLYNLDILNIIWTRLVVVVGELGEATKTTFHNKFHYLTLKDFLANRTNRITGRNWPGLKKI